MSDTRRRRKSNQSCGSDDLSDSCEELNATKETQSSEQTDGHQDSECEIYASDSDAESQDGALRESGDGQEEEKPQKKLDDDEDRRNPQYIPKRGTFYEHDDRTTDEVTEPATEAQSERETKEKKVWKDKEDRWDHDRYNDEEQAPKSHAELIAVYGYDIRNEEGPPRARRRRRYGRGPNKYTRNWEDEDAYGKPGTNVTNRNRKFNRSGEDFPALAPNKNAPAQVEEPVISSAWYSSKNKPQSKAQNFPPLQAQNDNAKAKSVSTSSIHTNENKAPNEPTNPAWKKDSKHTGHSQNSNGNNSGDTEKLVNAKTSPRDSNKKNVQESVSLAASKTRGRGFRTNLNNNMVANRTVETKPKGRGPGPIAAENKRNNTVQNDDEQQITHDMKHVSIGDGTQYHHSGKHNKNFYGQSSNQQRSGAALPRMQQQQQQQQQPQSQQQQQSIQQQDGSGNRPKRYSSLRQRPTVSDNPGQQNYPPQHGQHGQHGQHNQHNQHGQHSQHNQHNQHGQHGQHNQHGYFPPQAGNSRGVLESQGYPQGHFEQTTPVAAATAPMTGQPVIPIPPNGQPASYAPPPFLVPPPQFIPPQTAPPSIINYVPGPNGPAFPPNFQGYQGYSPPVQAQRAPPPQELFQPQGCTYYSPAQQQQQQQQSAPMRRPKAAIPILPPPEDQHQGTRGRGRNMQQQPTGQTGVIQQTEEDIKMNFVEEDKKTIPEQFDDMQNEQIAEIQQTEINEDVNEITSIENETVQKEIEDPNVDVPLVSSPEIVTEQLVDINPSDPLKNTIHEEDIVPIKTPEAVVEKTETETNKIENVVAEGTVIEETAA